MRRTWGIRLAASAALVVAGLLSVAAGMQRWWPVCRPGRMGSAACERVQDHRFDYLLPSAPYEPLGNAAMLQGLAYVVLAAGIALLTVLVRRNVTMIASLIALTVATGVTGCLNLIASQGVAPEIPRYVELVLFVPLLAAPIVYLFAWGQGTRDSAPSKPRRADLVLFVALAVASPLVEFFAISMVAASYDTPPWSGTISGWFLLIAGLAAAYGLRGQRVGSIIPGELAEVGAPR